jgi:putative glutamine amidotransferase
MAGEKYIIAVREGAQALPLLIPVLPQPLQIEELLVSVDGLLFTGSLSNVSPKLYNGAAPRDGAELDENRDATTIPLLKAAVAAGTPVLCICRGFQELNVAFGGTLHQHLHEQPGRSDHREIKSAELDVRYGPTHEVRVAEEGILSGLVATRTFFVNSLHWQGIDRLALPLHADAAAHDGTIEAVSLPGAKEFILGLQWHPEWRWRENEVSRAIFAAFGDAVRKRGRSLKGELRAMISPSAIAAR